AAFLKSVTYDERYVPIKRPTIVTGGELTMTMLDLKFNPVGKFYEAPLQMKANGGILMIDDFGRQQVRAMDLLNRWIVPLEKRYDYLMTSIGKYTMERVTFTPDLIDAACLTYFISNEKRDFGAKLRLE